MYLAKVIGTVVSTSKDAHLVGSKLLLVQRMTERMEASGATEIAIDSVGAGAGETVIISKGSSARYIMGDRNSPVDAAIVGIVDSVEVNC